MLENKMKAIVCDTYGPPEVAKLKEVAIPIAKPKEVLVKVHYTSVNRTDCGFRSASYFIIRIIFGFFKPKKPILGGEFAGEIVEIGADVSKFKIGDRVFGYNEWNYGAHAEFMSIGEDECVAIMPEGYSYKEAVAICEGATYALVDLCSAGLKSGQKILINGATGGIGSAAVQLAKHMECQVDAVCATDYIEVVKSLGANKVTDYLKEDFTQSTGQYDVIFDAVGKSTFGKCKSLLKPNGIYVSTELGPYFQNPFLAIFGKLKGGKRVIFPIPKFTQETALFLKDLAGKGEFKPLIDRVYSLNQITKAYAYVETGEKIGNVLIEVREDQ
jgi:NADPH:quinone reductase-like Zn-dependent oxidoreductase